MLTYIAIAVLLTLFLSWIFATIRRASRYDRKQMQDLDKIMHMDSAELTELLNGKK